MEYQCIESCPICEKTTFSDHLICTDYFATNETFELKKCNSCGFVFTQNFPIERFIGKYYEVPNYISHSDTKTGIVNYLYHFARNFMLKRKCGLVVSESKLAKGSILDYGAGTGYFLNTIHQLGWEALGIEKSATGRDFAKKEFSLDLKTPEELSLLPGESFDVITLWHVLEHIENLEEVLLQFKHILKPNGVLIVAVPNSESYDADYYKEEWAAYDVPRHLWHFSSKTIELLTQKMGFKLISKRGMPLDAFYISMMSEKNKGNKFAFISGMMVGLRAFVASFTNTDKSSSVIYTFKK